MSQNTVGWVTTMREILKHHRDVVIDDITRRKRAMLDTFLKSKTAHYLWIVLAITIFHLKLLHAITYPLHYCISKGIKSKTYSSEEEPVPRTLLHKVRGRVAMMFFAFLAIWHYFSWINPMSALQWNLSVRSQVNWKPQMLVAAKGHPITQIPTL
ncbi:unnamed protein product [Thelazia callipaeda]|uniref:G_PROTEIN_RECEP_F1_2 domain-containing protein n=1 Tax=Thelazia callipaeda TaxID=103827 RepID=A0A0N5CVF7_THECL|nr:unnamed protein product [Thelazia callipaeda]